jgi:Zn-finger nucleic acid-binding protein
MECPVCKVELKMSDRQGIEIDYCIKCRGVWLDRGELDKVVERSMPDLNRTPEVIPMSDYADRRGCGDQPGYYKHKKRKSLLRDLFDF